MNLYKILLLEDDAEISEMLKIIWRPGSQRRERDRTFLADGSAIRLLFLLPGL